MTALNTSRVPIPFHTSRRNVGLVLRRCRGQGPHLAMTGKPRGVSRVVAGFSSFDGEHSLPHVLAQGYTCVPHPEPSSLLPPHTIPLGHPSVFLFK